MDRYLVDGPLWLGISRGIAGFFGLICLLDAFRALILRTPSADFGWVDFSPCEPEIARGLLAFAGVGLLLFALTHRLPALVRSLSILGIMALVAVAVANALAIHKSIGQGVLRDGIPMSAHLVTLMVPVVFGAIRGPAYGPLRFPTGGLVLVLSFAAAAVGFSVGYVSSLSKFHLPQAADAIVVMHPYQEASEPDASQHIATTQRLVESGYTGRVVLVRDAKSMVPPLAPEHVQQMLPAGTELFNVSIENDEDYLTVFGEGRPSALLFVGDRREAPRMRLIGQYLSDRVAFVAATERNLDESVVDEVKRFWTAWMAPLRNRVQQKLVVEADKALQ